MSSALVAMTTIAFVVALATAIPPSTRPVNIPPALPVGCRRDDGTVVVGLFPGGTKQTGCEYCECDRYGHVTCMQADCAAPRCVDPQKGECCSTCPNGKGSRLWVWIGARMIMHIIIAYTHKQVLPCTCTHTYTHIRARTHAQARTYACTSTHARAHTRTRARTHTHTHTHRKNTTDETMTSLYLISIL